MKVVLKVLPEILFFVLDFLSYIEAASQLNEDFVYQKVVNLVCTTKRAVMCIKNIRGNLNYQLGPHEKSNYFLATSLMVSLNI